MNFHVTFFYFCPMRTFLYGALLFVTQLVLPILALFSPKLALFRSGRKGLLKNLKNTLSDNTAPIIWMHASSVGEFEQGLPVVELLKQSFPRWKVLVTFFSPSGYEAVNNPIIDYKFYLPLDTSKNVKEFIDSVDPKMALFIKYEFWFNYLKELNKREIPTFSVSSIFRPTQIFFKSAGAWNRKMLHAFTWFMVQDQQSLDLLQSIDLTNATITGDTRFDRVLKIKDDPTRFPEIEAFCAGRKVFIVGSLRPEDDTVVFEFVKAHPDLKFIIAPHEITEKHMLKIEQHVANCVRHSKLTDEGNANNVLIIDSIGKLSRLYRLADFAYVGGGLSDGIHNILEPAVYNIPVFFGNKYYKKFKEAVDLAAIGGASPVANASHITDVLKQFEDEQNLEQVRKSIEGYVNANRGAAEKVASLIEKMVEK